MADKRELILARIVVVLKGLPDFKEVFRNEIDAARKNQPAITLLDGDESVYRANRVPSRVAAPQIMRMRPGLFITVKDQRPKPNDVGTLLNSLRIKALKALYDDAELRTLIGTNGALDVQGVITDLKAGAAIAGEMNLNISINYVFDLATA